MEPPGGLPPDKDKQVVLHQQQPPKQQKPNLTLNIQPVSLPLPQVTTSSITSASTLIQPQQSSLISGGLTSITSSSGSHLPPQQQQTIEKLSRPLAFDKVFIFKLFIFYII